MPKPKTNIKELHLEKVDPIELEIEPYSGGLVLLARGKPLTLLSGYPLIHSRLAFMEHVCDEFSGFGFITVDEQNQVVSPLYISSYTLLSTQRELESDSNHLFLKDFQKWLLFDLTLHRSAGPEVVDQMARWGPILDYLNEKKIRLPSLPQSYVDCAASDDTDMVLGKMLGEDLTNRANEDSDSTSVQDFLRVVQSDFSNLGAEEQAVILFLHRGHQVVLFPMLLAMGKCTATEYANGLMAAHCLLETAFGDVMEEDHAGQTRNFREDAQIALRFLETARSPWIKEIEAGETEIREFKSTLRYDLKTHEFNRELEHSTLKTIVGFMNTGGGTLFIGIGDPGNPIGIELDGFANEDKFSLHIINHISSKVGKSFLGRCSFEFDDIAGKKICKIVVKPSPYPAYFNELKLKANGVKDAFYIRGGPSTHRLEGSEIDRYLAARFDDDALKDSKAS